MTPGGALPLEGYLPPEIKLVSESECSGVRISAAFTEITEERKPLAPTAETTPVNSNN